MTEGKRATGAFREGLRDALPEWVTEGLLDSEAAARLTERYRLDELGREGAHRLAAFIYGLAGLLVGGGVIAFVAANWRGIPLAAKTTLLVGGLLVVNAAGFWLWRRTSHPKLGQALLFCGCLIFGADIGLLAQLFHVRSHWYGGVGAWALGTLAMALAVRSLPAALLALGTSFAWHGGHVFDHEHVFPFYPLLLPLVFGAMAAWMRSRLLLVPTWVLTGAAVMLSAGADADVAWAVFLALAAWGCLLSALAGHPSAPPLSRVEGGFTEGLGYLALSGVAYLLAFEDVAHEVARRSALEGGAWLAAIVVLLVATVVLASLEAVRAAGERARLLRLGPTLVGIAVAAATCWLGVVDVAAQEVYAVVIFNALGLLLAAAGIAAGMASTRRGPFWSGALLAVALVVSRFLEYDTSLMAKSAVFTTCGIGLGWAGVKYERWLRRMEVAS